MRPSPVSPRLTRTRPSVCRAHRPRLEPLEGRALLAALIVVTNPADSGPGTLRDAIQQVDNSGAPTEIAFADGLSAITLTSGPLPTITSSITIVGPDGGVAIMRSQAPGTPAFRILNIANSVPASTPFPVDLENLTISGGDATDGPGGGISAVGCSLRVVGCTIENNASSFSGGGIRASTSALSIVASTIRGNTAGAGGGGVFFAGASSCDLESSTVAGNTATSAGGGLDLTGFTISTVTNSTFTGNVAGTTGGGLFVNPSGGTIAIAASTIASNSAGSGPSHGVGGIAAAGVPLTLADTIVAGNTGGDIVGKPSGQSNLVGDGSGGLDPATNLLGVDPRLGPLQDNGGPTQTMLPQTGSPAIGAGANLPGVSFDQRFGSRPSVGPFDIGAVQLGSEFGYVVNTTSDAVFAGPGLVSLREAIDRANAEPGAQTITFDPAVFAAPRTITLDPALGTLNVTQALTIDGPQGGVTVARDLSPGTPAFRILALTNPNLGTLPIPVDLENLTITGGDATDGPGGGISSAGCTLRIVDCTIEDNTTSVSGGGIRATNGDLTIVSSSILGNASRAGGGGILVTGSSTFDLESSTVAKNTSATAGGGLNLANIGTRTITNSTIEGNLARTTGGGVFANPSGGTMMITASTIADNVAVPVPTSGTLLQGVGGIQAAGVPLTLTDTVVARDSGGDILGAVSGRSNLVGDGSGGLDPATNLLGVDPKLGPLRDNGGPTQTEALLAGSPAIGHGVASLLPVGLVLDQRGAGFSRVIAGRLDIGAVESTPAPTVVSVASGTPNGSYGAGSLILVTVSFAAPVFVTGTPTLRLNDGGVATYAGGSGLSTLTFAHVVSPGQNSPRLEVADTAALALAGGSIRDITGRDAVLTLPPPGGTGSLAASANLVVDTVAPRVVAYRVLYGSKSFDLTTAPSRGLPWQISGIQVIFSEPIDSGSGASLAGVGAATLSGLASTALTWKFSALADGHVVTDLAGAGPSALRDAAGNPLASGAGFARAFDLLYGDANGDGVVSITDAIAVRAGIASGLYDPFDDLTGDGLLSAADIAVAQSRIGHKS